MTIEALLTSIDSKLGTLIQISQTQIAECESGVAGAGADPVVAQQVGQAIAAAGGAAAPAKRGRGRPQKEQTEAAGSWTSKPDAPAAPATTAAPEPDPFAIGTPAAAVVEKPRSMEEVRAALLVYQARNGQAAAMKLIKDTAGKETLAALVASDLPKLFKAAIPAGEFSVDDVKITLVKAEERRNGGGAEVLQKLGAVVTGEDGTTKITINALKPEHFIAAINAAQAVK